MTLFNTGREPFFFSVYFGVPLFAVALLGLVTHARSSWGVFWAAAGATSLVLAFGVFTPIYPLLKTYVPVLGSFRFPVKYLVVFSIAVAAGAAAGWDAIVRGVDRRDPDSVFPRARIYAVGLAVVMALAAVAAVVSASYFPEWTAERAAAFARTLGAKSGLQAMGQIMVRTLPGVGSTLVPIAAGAAFLLVLSTRARPSAVPARYALLALIAADLIVRAWGINPVLDARYLAEPDWLSRTKVDADARFYVGGKRDGTLDVWDPDASRGFLNPPGLVGSASRAALSGQTAYYPSAFRGREMLSYDLAVLWPKLFERTSARFFDTERPARDLFLDRTGVRFRVLPGRLAAGHEPIVRIPYYAESSLYDWGTGVAQRAAIVAASTIVADPYEQVDRLFRPGWNSREVVLIDREPEAAGDGHAAVAPFAKIVTDRTTHVVVEAGAPEGGGYLVLLDSYAPGWRATVDGNAATIVRANGLFRAVRLAPGRHIVAFTYRPTTLMWGALISTVGVLVSIALWIRGRSSRRNP
jgi:hypothetical protein